MTDLYADYELEEVDYGESEPEEYPVTTGSLDGVSEPSRCAASAGVGLPKKASSLLVCGSSSRSRHSLQRGSRLQLLQRCKSSPLLPLLGRLEP